MRKVVALNDKGQRIGETHQKAKLLDKQVDEIRELHEAGRSYTELSRMFNIAKSTVRDICKYKIRAQTPMRWKTLRA